MTEQYQGVPAYAPAPPAPPAGNGFGVAALVLGIIAVVFSFIPLVGVAAFILGPLALIFGIIGVLKKNRKKGGAIAGLILGVAAIIIAALVTAATAAVVSSIDTELKKESSIEYVVTADGKATVSYGTTSGTSNDEFTDKWSKKTTATGFDAASLVVTGDLTKPSQKVTCEILVNGESAAKESGTSMVTCSASTMKP